MPPRVTVAISFHDEEEHLGGAIRSILNQSFRDFELLLIDDGSTDRSLTVAQSFVDDRVRILADGHHRFLAARLNEALRHAKGELFARMDGDDLSHPERLALEVAHLDRNRAAFAVGTWAGLVDASGEAFGVVEAVRPRPTRTAESLLKQGVIPHATMLARTEWLRSFGYDETLTRAEDRDLWCRMDRSTRIDVIEDVLYVIRVLAHRSGFLPDYLAGQAELRRVIRRYGPALIGRTETERLALSSLLKSNVMRVAHRMHLAERIVRRRGRTPTADEIQRMKTALQAP